MPKLYRKVWHSRQLKWALAESYLSSFMYKFNPAYFFLMYQIHPVFLQEGRLQDFKALLMSQGLKHLAFPPCFVTICREITTDCWLQIRDYIQHTWLSQKMQIVISCVFLTSERNKQRDQLFQSRRRKTINYCQEVGLSFPSLLRGTGLYCQAD